MITHVTSVTAPHWAERSFVAVHVLVRDVDPGRCRRAWCAVRTEHGVCTDCSKRHACFCTPGAAAVARDRVGASAR